MVILLIYSDPQLFQCSSRTIGVIKQYQIFRIAATQGQAAKLSRLLSPRQSSARLPHCCSTGPQSLQRRVEGAGPVPRRPSSPSRKWAGGQQSRTAYLLA